MREVVGMGCKVKEKKEQVVRLKKLESEEESWRKMAESREEQWRRQVKTEEEELGDADTEAGRKKWWIWGARHAKKEEWMYEKNTKVGNARKSGGRSPGKVLTEEGGVEGERW